jgi:hypothetical protein
MMLSGGRRKEKRKKDKASSKRERREEKKIKEKKESGREWDTWQCLCGCEKIMLSSLSQPNADTWQGDFLLF